MNRTARRVFLGFTAALLPSLVALYAADVPKPNVVIVHSHDFGQYLHCYGVKTVQTPNLDKLAEQGVRFARLFCTNPGCSPARASLFTGRFPHSNGVMGLTHGNFGWDLNPNEKHLGQFLKDAATRPSASARSMRRSGPQRCGYMKYINESRPPGDDRRHHGTQAVAGKGRPFFLCTGFIDTHRPYAHSMPDSSLGVDVPGFCTTRRGCARNLPSCKCMLHLDKQIGRLIETIRAALVWKPARWSSSLRTMALRCRAPNAQSTSRACDCLHPCLPWPRGLARRRSPERDGVEHRLFAHDSGIRGRAISAEVQGRSFAGLLDGKSYTPRDMIFGELTYHDYYDPGRSVRTETHKLIVNFSSAPGFMDPSQQWYHKSEAAEDPEGVHPDAGVLRPHHRSVGTTQPRQ